MQIRALKYGEARLEYFRALKARRERGLKLWLRRLEGVGTLRSAIWDGERAAMGAEIRYLEDVIQMLEEKQNELDECNHFSVRPDRGAADRGAGEGPARPQRQDG